MRVNLQTRDLATAKRMRDAEKAKLLKTDRDKQDITLRAYVKTYLDNILVLTDGCVFYDLKSLFKIE